MVSNKQLTNIFYFIYKRSNEFLINYGSLVGKALQRSHV